MAKKRRRTASARFEQPTLPFDVLHSVLSLLPQADLREAAATSHTFRDAAKQAGLYIHRTIRWDPAVDVSQDLSTFLDVANYAIEYDCRISFELACIGMVPWTDAEKETLYDICRETFEALARGITLVMDYLVFLRVSVPDYLRTELDAVLLDPAPQLHSFEIRDYGGQGALRTAPLIRLPSDLFAGDAPKLRSVSLEYIPLGPHPIAAFSRVEHARFEYQEIFPETNVAHHFPHLNSLYIEYNREGLVGHPPECNLRGLALAKLTIASDDEQYLLPAIARDLELSSIPVIECHSPAGAHETIWAAPLCADDDTELCAHISHCEGPGDMVSIDVTSRGADWLCAYRIEGWELDEPYALFGQDVDLVSLRLDNKYIAGLLESGISLPRLRHLRIDLRPRGHFASMIWPLAWGVRLSLDNGGDCGGEYSVPCPSLETLAIVALEKPMLVRDTEVVELSEALGQLDREDGERAQLILRGVSFYTVGLDEIFSAVRSLPIHKE
ncbi:hypothetical protein AURDEDRAFT_166588 [Auricularia subglabra TFB-10046 SS5]|nr:hypothetical protein AURDEDRAFT_166588 [Auricularia subglabra TFB-10046 SS5]